MIPKGKVEIEVSAGGNHIKIVVDSPVFKGHTEEFDLGVETERNTIDGRKVKVVTTYI
jgi:hypothetical protein